MCSVGPPPLSRVEPVVDVLHGVPITDPYRWLEDQNSPETRAWIAEQTRYARAYLDNIPGRDRIRERLRELLDVETYDSFVKSGNRYFFRKRLRGREQPSIYFRERPQGDDQLLVDPADRGTGDYTAVKPLRVSQDGSLLLYEVKQGGERTGIFEILDVANRRTLPDSLPHGYLRGFAFAPDARSFYYVHEASDAKRPFYRAVFHHVLGTKFESDREIFCAGEDKDLRVAIVPGRRHLGLLVHRFGDKTSTDFYLWGMGRKGLPVPVFRNADYCFAPIFLGGRILAVTDHSAPNRRVVEVQPRQNLDPFFLTLVSEADALIRDWLVTANHILVSYVRGSQTQVDVFDSFGKREDNIPLDPNDTFRLAAGGVVDDEVLIERENFTERVEVQTYSAATGTLAKWAQRETTFDSSPYTQASVSFRSKDGANIPMFLVGRRDALSTPNRPTVLSSYGGFGVSMTPQFSVLVTYLMERGCLFALPNIRGGSEFGSAWYTAAKRQNRQVAFDDFLAAADSLVLTRRTQPSKLAAFGGSNSALLVAAAFTQRPDLFRAAVCIAPLFDMLRYHLFDNAHVWKEEFGSADDPDDFRILLSYSPYHSVQQEASYPAVLIVSGDADQNCNALHARKMTAKLQAASHSPHPALLDYSPFRGHSPVLPLSTRIDALTDRLAFLCDELEV